MNWNSILESVLAIVLPPLAAALVALAVAWINKAAKNLSAAQMTAIRDAVTMAVSFAEQTGLLKTGEQKKADAIAAAQGYLAKQGVTADLSLLDNMIEAAVRNEINWRKDLTPPAPNVTATVVPVFSGDPAPSMINPAVPPEPPAVG